jgi:hypothetical protein
LRPKEGMAAPALRAGAASQRRPAPFGRWPPPKKKVYDGKWDYTDLRQRVSECEAVVFCGAAASP